MFADAAISFASPGTIADNTPLEITIASRESPPPLPASELARLVIRAFQLGRTRMGGGREGNPLGRTFVYLAKVLFSQRTPGCPPA